MKDQEQVRGGCTDAPASPSSPAARPGRRAENAGSAATSPAASRASAVRALSLFRGVPGNEQERLAFAASFQRLDRGHRLAAKVGPEEAAILLRGRAKRSVPRGQSAGELMLELHEPGDLLFDTRWISPATEYAGETVAIENSTLLLLPHEALDATLLSCPVVAHRLLELFAKRVARLSTLAAQNACLDVADRLYCRIVELSIGWGRPVEDGLLVEHGLAQRELASFCAASREIVNRQLGEWRKRGLVEPRRRALLVRDIRALTLAVSPEARRVGFGAGDGRASLLPPGSPHPSTP